MSVTDLWEGDPSPAPQPIPAHRCTPQTPAVGHCHDTHTSHPLRHSATQHISESTKFSFWRPAPQSGCTTAHQNAGLSAPPIVQNTRNPQVCQERLSPHPAPGRGGPAGLLSEPLRPLEGAPLSPFPAVRLGSHKRAAVPFPASNTAFIPPLLQKKIENLPSVSSLRICLFHLLC